MRHSGSLFKAASVRALPCWRRQVLAIVCLFFSTICVSGSGTINLDIPAQKADNALLLLAENAQIQIIFDPEVAASQSAQALRGEFTLKDALKKLLSSTNLRYEFNSPTVVVVRKQYEHSEQAAETAEETEPEILEDIIVTGTLLRRTDQSSSVVVIEQPDIERLGVHTTEDIIRSLLQNFSNLNTGTSVFNQLEGYFNTDLQGNSAANLRGLGVGSTLVLINGRRTSGSALSEGAFINLATIPASAVARVEVLTDGGSAIYGSDAIAGVINFILRKDYHGVNTSVRYENSRNGGDSYSVNQLLGVNWESGNLTAALSYTERKPVLTHKTGWISNDLSAWGGRDNRSTFDTQPGNVSSYGTLPAGHSGVDTTPDDFSPDNLIPADNVRRHLSPGIETRAIYFNANQAVAHNMTLFGDILYSRAQSRSERFILSAPGVVPSTNAFNPFGKDVWVSYLFAAETAAGTLPYEVLYSEQGRIESNLGLTLNLPWQDWKLDVTGGYSSEVSDSYQLRVDRSSDLYRELIASDDPARAINLFGDGSVQSPELGKTFGKIFVRKPESYVATFSALAEGRVADFESGELRLAVGAEWRREWQDYIGDPSRAIDPDYRNTEDGIGEQTILSPERTISAFYASTALPLIDSQQKNPWAESLVVSLSTRWEHYEIPNAPITSGPAPLRQTATFDHLSSRIGIAWEPIPDLILRTSWTEAFKAPGFDDLLSATDFCCGDSIFLIETFDPFNPDPNRPGEFLPGKVSVPLLFGGNPGLKPETADITTFGFDWLPAAIPGLTVKATLLNIDYQNLIFTPNTVDLPAEVLMALSNVAIRDNNGVLTQLRQVPINIASRESKSVDFTVDYQTDTRWGHIGIGLAGVYTGKTRDVIAPGVRAINTDNTNFGNDRWKLRGKLTWDLADYGAAMFLNYTSGYDHVDQGIEFNAETREIIPNPPYHVESYFTVEVTGRYDLNSSGWRVLGGVRNVFNNKFPFSNGFNPFDLTRVDSRGRVAFVEVKYALE